MSRALLPQREVWYVERASELAAFAARPTERNRPSWFGGTVEDARTLASGLAVGTWLVK